jgi:hypothetical protein
MESGGPDENPDNVVDSGCKDGKGETGIVDI